MKKVKPWIVLLLAICFVCSCFAVQASDGEGESTPTEGPASDFTLDARGALLMEASTGTVLFEQNADAAYSPASVTKIMTLLLVMEAVESGKITLDAKVPVSELAASMGGSQVFLEVGEEMTVRDMIKCTVIASANDAAVALAEYVAGSEGAFVAEMNRRAEELGMKNTHFENVTGLDDTTVNHMTSARDIAIMSQALIAHELILEFSSIWMDTIRDGAFTLTNTNRLIRFYQGANGLKTGSTEKAKFCISATAKRGEMTLIAVIMGAPTRDIRNDAAKKLLDYGFANYALYRAPGEETGSLPVKGGRSETCRISRQPFSCVVKKHELAQVKAVMTCPEYLYPGIKQGDVIGGVRYMVGENELGRSDICAEENVLRVSYLQVVLNLLRRLVFS